MAGGRMMSSSRNKLPLGAWSLAALYTLSLAALVGAQYGAYQLPYLAAQAGLDPRDYAPGRTPSPAYPSTTSSTRLPPSAAPSPLIGGQCPVNLGTLDYSGPASTCSQRGPAKPACCANMEDLLRGFVDATDALSEDAVQGCIQVLVVKLNDVGVVADLSSCSFGAPAPSPVSMQAGSSSSTPPRQAAPPVSATTSTSTSANAPLASSAGGTTWTEKICWQAGLCLCFLWLGSLKSLPPISEW